jgi:hypothetical protein
MTWNLSAARKQQRGHVSTFLPAALLVSASFAALANAQQVQVQTSRDDGGPARTHSAQPDAAPPTPAQPELTHPADGARHGALPLEAYAVVPGTRVLVRLEEDLSTAEVKEGKRFTATTMEPLAAGSGIYLPSGAQILGHVSRVEPAGITGRAKIWLVFDEVHTRFGSLPIVASVVGVPGDHSVRSSPQKEGLVEGKSSTQQAAGQAAAEGAGMGALHGIKDKNAKEAAEGAAEAALAAYLMEAGRGHELQLSRGSKLEVELERALYLVRD